MHRNSIEAYITDYERLSQRAKDVYICLFVHGPQTAREVKQRMGFQDMNSVRPRLTDLKMQNWVRENGTRIEDGRRVTVYEAIPDEARNRMVSTGQGELL